MSNTDFEGLPTREFRVYGWKKIVEKIRQNHPEIAQEIAIEYQDQPDTNGLILELFENEIPIIDAIAKELNLDCNTIDPNQFGGMPINKRSHDTKEN